MKEYYFTKAKNLRHITQKGGEWTLCGNFYTDSDNRFFYSNPIYKCKVKGNERYKKGRDCKTCFRKAKLKIGGK